MKKIILPVVLFLTLHLQAQVFQVDTLQYKGDADTYINFVILGDGYTLQEQDTFHNNAVSLKNGLLSQSPLSNYANYINVFAIRVISNESGAKHPVSASDCNNTSPQVPFSDPDNYFGSTFDYGGIHRLIVATKTNKIASVLAQNLPNYDQAIVLANTPYYGGSGGQFATMSMHTASSEILLHECGHSFAGLADEYYAGDIYNAEKPNMTQETDPSLVKWRNWLNTGGVGIYPYCCGDNSSQWYRPHQQCKMEFLGFPFCHVCTETIVEKIHSLVNPLVSYDPATPNIHSVNRFLSFQLTEIMKPVPNTLKTEWFLDGKSIKLQADTFVLDQDSLIAGTHILTIILTDTTTFLRVDDHAATHLSSVSWSILKDATGTYVNSTKQEISYTIYPNPSSNVLMVSAETGSVTGVSWDIISADGKIVQQITGESPVDGKVFTIVDIGGLAAGNYFLVLKAGNIVSSKLFIKK